jgi:hypothetical protein
MAHASRRSSAPAGRCAHRLHDDGQHRRLEPEEQRLDEADIAVERVDPAERHDRDDARQHEQDAGDRAAARAVQQPADVGGELLRLGAGSSMQKFSACRNRASPSQRFSSTRMRCITAIWPAGPPKLSRPRCAPRPASPRPGCKVEPRRVGAAHDRASRSSAGARARIPRASRRRCRARRGGSRTRPRCRRASPKRSATPATSAGATKRKTARGRRSGGSARGRRCGRPSAATA